MGSGSFVETLRDVQHEIEAEPGLLAHDSNAEDESLRDLFRYLSIGLLVQGTEGSYPVSSRAGFVFPWMPLAGSLVGSTGQPTIGWRALCAGP